MRRSSFVSRSLTVLARGSAALALLLAPSCIYTNVVTTLDEDVDATPVATKRGESTARSFLWLVALGDAGLQAAAQNGGLTKMHSADVQYVSVLFGLYFSRTTIVYGE
ncbi:MAG: TRL-like family protein [Planctomycetes bacterium]|nr:TRL-like family protein [Planctomycetota bacterium]